MGYFSCQTTTASACGACLTLTWEDYRATPVVTASGSLKHAPTGISYISSLMTISSEPGSQSKAGSKKSHHHKKAGILRETFIFFFFFSLIISQILQASPSE